MNFQLYRRLKKRVKETTGEDSGIVQVRSGTLYIVAGPIGNVEDITIRALRVLRTVAIVAAEDASSTQRLLRHYGFRTTLTTYDHRNYREKAAVLINRLRGGQDVALVSDCGTPVIYDPGTWLVQRAMEESLPVRSIPGPSAPIAALAVAGLSGDAFLFQGSLPSSRTLLRRFFQSVKRDPRTLVFFVPSRRLGSTMSLLLEMLGNRRVLVAADLTKASERLVWGNLSDLIRTQALHFDIEDVTVVVEGLRTGIKNRRRATPR